MGRKSQSKQASKTKPGKTGKEVNKFLQQQRKELSILVDKLLRLTSVFQATLNFNKSWEHHLEICTILRDIQNIEGSELSKGSSGRQDNIDKYISWLKSNGAEFDGIEISEFKGYDLGLKATKAFTEGSLVLTVPSKIMMNEQHAKESELKDFIAVDPLLQNMPNITLALYLLLERNKPDSIWKPYIDILPQTYSTVLYFTPEELLELKPSPVLEPALKLYRSITRQYAYFYNKIHTLDIPVLKKLKDIFTFKSYRWAVSTVMTRQNNIQLANSDITAFIPLWDMCNHEHGKITTDFNKELDCGECYALRDFKPGEQIFIFYGARYNSDLFLYNGFVYPSIEFDSVSLLLGVSSGDPLRSYRTGLLTKLGLGGVAHYHIHPRHVSAELRAVARILCMDKDELTKWSADGMPCELVSTDDFSPAIGVSLERRAYNYLATRCRLVRAGYADPGEGGDSVNFRNVKLLKKCEMKVLDSAIENLESIIAKLPSDDQI